MSRRATRVSYLAAALLLAAVTLATFVSLQNYGPESTVRGFHEAALAEDRDRLQALCREPLSEPRVQALLTQLRSLAADNPSFGYRLARVRREPRRVFAEVQYITRSNRVVSLYWVVEKFESRNWRVSGIATFEINTRGWWM